MKILVIGPSWVGDMMMSQSLYRTLQARYPQAIIDVMAPAWCRPLLSRMPEVNEAIPMPLVTERWKSANAANWVIACVKSATTAPTSYQTPSNLH